MGGTCSKGGEDYKIRCSKCKTKSPLIGKSLCNKCIQDIEQLQDTPPKKKIKSKKKKKSYVKKRRRTKRKNKIEHYKRTYREIDNYLLWWVN